MRLAVMVTPQSDQNLKLVAQAGAEEVAVHYPGLALADLKKTCERVEAAGMKVTVVERLIPHMKFVHNLPGRDEQIEGFCQLIRNMGKCDIPVLCYNWMPDDDWQRTSLNVKERGGAKVTEFDLTRPSQVPTDTGYGVPGREGHITSELELWENLEYFLRKVIPVAEESGVKLALHPDDPPLSPLRGQPRIIISSDAMEQAVNLVPSPNNGICFCQGTFASIGGVDVEKAIAQLNKYIHFIHFRDVNGQIPHFTETYIDNGKTDMAAMMKVYLSHNLDVPIRPDHVPTMEGEGDEDPGYQTLGRIHALGYMKGLIHALS